MKSVESWDGFQQQKRGKKMQDNKPVDPKYLIKLGTPIRKPYINGYCKHCTNLVTMITALTLIMPVTRLCTAWDFFTRESDGQIRTVHTG